MLMACSGQKSKHNPQFIHSIDFFHRYYPACAPNRADALGVFCEYLIPPAFKLHQPMAETSAQLQLVRPTSASGRLIGISGSCSIVKGDTLTAAEDPDSRCGTTCNSPMQWPLHGPFDIPRSGGGGANGD